MNAPARKIEHGFVAIAAENHPLEAVNDNVGQGHLRTYGESIRIYAGAEYQPAGSKLWWLP